VSRSGVEMSEAGRKRIVVGVSGASGALYTQRLLEALIRLGHEAHVTVTPPGARLLHDEIGLERVDLRSIAGLAGIGEDEDPNERGLFLYNNKDIGAAIASGSFLHDGMVVMPCSSHTLNAVARGLGDNLLCRAAAVTLKERRPLIVCHRESPVTLIDIEAMKSLTEAGAIVAPTNPGFYLLPKTIGELVDFVVAKPLDLLKIEHDLSGRWDEHLAERAASRGR